MIEEKSGSGAGSEGRARAESVPEGRRGVSLRVGKAKETPERRGKEIRKARTVLYILTSPCVHMTSLPAINRPIQ